MPQEAPMTFEETLARVIEVLQREGRVSYRALRRRFALEEAYLEDLKVELIEAKQLARDENGRILVWAGDTATTAVPTIAPEETPGSSPAVQTPQEASSHVVLRVPEAEGANSPCCSATWQTRPVWRNSSIPKTSATSSAPIRLPA
jgi:hypothetical protein